MRKLLLVLGLLGVACASAFGVTTTTPMGNANYSMLITDQRIITTTTLTASRTITLISAGATCIGQTCGASAFEFMDVAGVVAPSTAISIVPQSGETINGSSASFSVQEPYSRIVMIPTSGTNWFIQPYQPGSIIGTTTSDNACAGCIGETFNIQTSNANTATTTSAPNLTSQAPTNVTSQNLTPGDWDCRGSVQLQPFPTAADTQFAAWISTTSATYPLTNAGNGLGANNVSFAALQAASVTSAQWALATAPIRISLASTSLVYLESVLNGTGGSAAGQMQCRRVR